MLRDRSSTFWGYMAGITTGVTYGMNPLFAKPLLDNGVSVDTMLFFRYIIAVVIMGGWLALRREKFGINASQLAVLAIMGLLFGCSSLFLFESYKYIPSGQATTIVYLYPALVAIIMVFMKVYPKWQVWLAIAFTFLGVVILCKPEGGTFNRLGVALAFVSALAYAIYIVLNRNRSVKSLSSNVLTFYVLLIGSVLFLIHHLAAGGHFLEGVAGFCAWGNIIGLAVFPTIVSMVTLAISIRLIGATKTSVLGVFEPVTAILIGAVMFHEPLTFNVFVGMVICLSAIIFMAFTTSRK